MLYTRPQLRLLVLLGATLLLGLAVREWRAGFPAQAERLESFDREEAPPLPPVPLRAPPSGKRIPRAGAAAASAAQGETEQATTRPRERKGREPATNVSDPRPLDLNRASLEELARLPGIGPGLARRILDERERRGRFDSPESLRGVLGVGSKKLAALRDLVTVGE